MSSRAHFRALEPAHSASETRRVDSGTRWAGGLQGGLRLGQFGRAWGYIRGSMRVSNVVACASLEPIPTHLECADEEVWRAEPELRTIEIDGRKATREATAQPVCGDLSEG